MLAALGIVAEPDALDLRVRPDVVNMPVQPLRGPLMMPKTSAKASWAQSTTKVNLNPALQAHVAEPPDIDTHRLNTSKDKGVSAWLCSQSGAVFSVQCSVFRPRRIPAPQ